MFLALCLLGVPSEFYNLLLMFCEKATAQDHFASRIIIMVGSRMLAGALRGYRLSAALLNHEGNLGVDPIARNLVAIDRGLEIFDPD